MHAAKAHSDMHASSKPSLAHDTRHIHTYSGPSSVIGERVLIFERGTPVFLGWTWSRTLFTSTWWTLVSNLHRSWSSDCSCNFQSFQGKFKMHTIFPKKFIDEKSEPELKLVITWKVQKEFLKLFKMLNHKETAVLPALFAFETRQGFLGHLRSLPILSSPLLYLYLLLELALDVEPPDRRIETRRITYLRNSERIDIKLDIFDLWKDTHLWILRLYFSVPILQEPLRFVLAAGTGTLFLVSLIILRIYLVSSSSSFHHHHCYITPIKITIQRTLNIVME